jgi:hypothetical protein
LSKNNFFEFSLAQRQQQWEQKRNSLLLNVALSSTAASVETLTGKLPTPSDVPYQQFLQHSNDMKKQVLTALENVLGVHLCLKPLITNE